jgi:pyruvate,orthophosphate dikinase
LELVIGKEFGSDNNPLFLAIRCSPRIDVDGTLDAIKNIGINDKIVDQLTKKTNSTWALEIYCDFIIDFSNKVFEIANKHFASVILKINDLKSKNSLTIEFLKECYRELKNIFFDLVGEEFPQDPYNQLFLGLSAAFSSWDSPVSNVYRKMNDLPFKWGMALIVEETVYGNINELSGVGKCIISSDTNELKILYKHNTLSLNEDDKFEVLDETNVNYLKILSERCKKLVLVDNYIIELDFVIKNGFMYIVGYKLQ